LTVDCAGRIERLLIDDDLFLIRDPAVVHHAKDKQFEIKGAQVFCVAFEFVKLPDDSEIECMQVFGQLCDIV